MSKDTNKKTVNVTEVEDNSTSVVVHPSVSNDQGGSDPAGSMLPDSSTRGKFVLSHAPEPSTTLMRSAVNKPSASLKRQINVAAPTDSSVPVTDPKSLSPGLGQLIKPKESELASTVQKSEQINHFGPSDMAAIAAPASPADMPANDSPLKTPEPPLDAPAPEQTAFEQSRPYVEHKPQTSADVMQSAMSYVNKPTEPQASEPSHTGRNVGLGVTAVVTLLLVVGFGLSQNVTSMRLAFASTKVGFGVSLPKSMPSGYSLSQLSYTTGSVATLFHSNSNSADYTIIQKSSPWNSAQLVANYVAPTDPSYLTVKASNKTIYLYGSHNATWVSNGIWYTVQSEGTISNDQLIQMASST